MGVGFLIALSSIALTGAGLIGFDAYKSKEKRNEAQSALKEQIESNPILSNLKLDDLINQAANLGYITKSDKSKYLNLLKDMDDDYGFWESSFDWNHTKTEEIARLFGVLTKVAPEVESTLDKMVGVDIRNTLANNVPAIQSAPSPGYFDTDFENQWKDMEADPLKWWTGEELAEHHNLPYDVDTIYDTVKQGTDANVKRDMYTSDSLRNEVTKDRPWEEASYLNSLRNTRSKAITSGATKGAQAANELLGLLSANQTSAQNQASLVNERWNAVQNSLLDDAEARLNANQQYQSLGLNIANSIEGLYENDVRRRQAELEAQAGLNAADELLRNERIQSNADMFAAYAVANANVNAARASVNDTTNRYAWMWDRFYGRAKEQGYGDVVARGLANSDFFNWVAQDATGTQNYRGLRTQQDNSY